MVVLLLCSCSCHCPLLPYISCLDEMASHYTPQASRDGGTGRNRMYLELGELLGPLCL
jgi:hypothetical protein